MDDHYFNGFYNNWRKSRFSCIQKYINQSFFLNKTLLEVGCGCGDNGKLFKDIGCTVTCTDARDALIMNGKIRYPELTFDVFDCDTQKLNKQYDIILDWGLLYHLDNMEDHLRDMCSNCNYLLLESEVCDTEELVNLKVHEHNSYDQSYHGKGSRPSSTLVEKILTDSNFEFIMIKDSILNSDFHIYDWEITNTKTWRHGLRRFWICWRKDVESPLDMIK